MTRKRLFKSGLLRLRLEETEEGGSIRASLFLGPRYALAHAFVTRPEWLIGPLVPRIMRSMLSLRPEWAQFAEWDNGLIVLLALDDGSSKRIKGKERY